MDDASDPTVKQTAQKKYDEITNLKLAGLQVEYMGCYQDAETGPLTAEPDAKRDLKKELSRDSTKRNNIHPYDCVARARDAKVKYLAF